MITKQDIYFLFDELWPEMEYSASYRDKCLAQFDEILTLFKAYQDSYNKLLNKVDELPNIGLVIASGLVFSANRDEMVPFDKYTTGWAIEKHIIPNNRISDNNYVNYSSKIVDYIGSSPHLSNIVDFVREANQTLYPIAPE